MTNTYPTAHSISILSTFFVGESSSGQVLCNWFLIDSITIDSSNLEQMYVVLFWNLTVSVGIFLSFSQGI